jgi:hypothetical protein
MRDPTMRQTILILGMHRSGTSALAGLCHLLGATPPAGMMQAAFDNPTGFWESFPITALNEAAFARVGHHWFDALTFDAAGYDGQTRQELAEACLFTLAQEYGEAPLFVLKDPRFSLLLKVWLPVFASIGIAVAPVLALRHPAEVTASLRRRDNMPIEIAAPMWLHYSLEAERQSRGRPRVFQSYDRLLQDWRGSLARIAAATGFAWPVPPETAATRIETFLRPHMRHHHAALGRIAVGRPPLSGWIAETYDAFRALEQEESATQYARLDEVHAAFAPWRAAASRISMAAAGGKEPFR